MLAAVPGGRFGVPGGDGHQPVRQAGKVRRGAQQPGYLGRLLRGGGPREQVHAPQPGGGGLPQFRVPGSSAALGQLGAGAVGALRVQLGEGHLAGHFLQRGGIDRLGQHQPAERPQPRRQQPVLQRRPPVSRARREPWRALLGEQHVADPGQRLPARERRHEHGRPACAQRQPPRPGGQDEHVLPGVAACGQVRAGGDHPHRTARLLPHPGNGDRGRPAPRRDQLRGPLRRPVIRSPVAGTRLVPPRRRAGNLRQLPGGQPRQDLP